MYVYALRHLSNARKIHIQRNTCELDWLAWFRQHSSSKLNIMINECPSISCSSLLLSSCFQTSAAICYLWFAIAFEAANQTWQENLNLHWNPGSIPEVQLRIGTSSTSLGCWFGYNGKPVTVKHMSDSRHSFIAWPSLLLLRHQPNHFVSLLKRYQHNKHLQFIFRHCTKSSYSTVRTCENNPQRNSLTKRNFCGGGWREIRKKNQWPKLGPNFIWNFRTTIFHAKYLVHINKQKWILEVSLFR